MKKENKRGFLAKISDNTKAAIFRWWLAGAIYLFVGWGTNIGLSGKAIDLVVALGLTCGVVNIFIYNPVVYGMFELQRRETILNKRYYERSVTLGVISKLVEVIRCLFVVLLVYYSYVVVNTAFNYLFNKPKDSTYIAGEPILFATFFLIYYSLFGKIGYWIIDIVKYFKKGGEKLE